MKNLKTIVFSGLLALMVLTHTPTALAIGTNGSFETGVLTGTQSTILAGDSTSIPGWTIVAGSIDYLSDGYWEASDGVRSIDLNSGLDIGSVSQTLTTIPGHTYKVLFDMAGNPNGPDLKTIDVAVNGTKVADFSFNKAGKTWTDMGWVTKTFQFTAVGTQTTIGFISTTQDTSGPALDNVRFEDLSAVTPTPTSVPTATPTTVPTATPTVVPTSIPTSTPTVLPTATPTSTPTSTPMPTAVATATPTVSPTPSDPDLPDACVGMTFAHVIKGTDGSNKLMGTNENDLIYAYDGSDTVYGKDGDDCIVGGDGSDNLNGGDGDDVLIGGEGADSLKGGKGADQLYGGEGSDDINGNDGDDTSYGDEGYDSCRGGNGRDTCNAEDSKECERNTRHKSHKIGIFHHFFSRH